MTTPPPPSPPSLNDRLFLALTALVVLAPLPLAANRPWSWSALSLAAALLTLVWVAARMTGRVKAGLELSRLAGPAALFLLACGWGWMQSWTVLPPSWAHPIWGEASAALGLDLAASVSGDPQRGGHALMRLLAYGLVFLLAAQLGRHARRASWGTKALAWAILAYGAQALLFHALDLDYVLWLPKWAYPGDATGTFVGRAAFGAFAGIGVLVCFALALRGVAATRPAFRPGERLERLLSRGVPWLMASFLLLVVLLASHSRGALLVTGLAALVLVVAATIGRLLRPRHAAVLIGLFAAGAAIGIVAFGEATLARMSGEGDMIGDRPNLLRLTWAAIADAPWGGHGLGAFEQTFLAYRDLGLPRPVSYEYAHNAWAETIMDLGWPMGLCLLAAILWVVAACARGLVVRRQDQIHPALALAVAGLLGAQALVDFTVQIPALAVIFAYLLGIGFAQSWPQR